MRNIKSINNLTLLLTKLILGICLFFTVNIKAATYNTATGELFLVSLINGSTTLSNITIVLNPDGTYLIKNGTETRPFLCPDTFTQSTLDSVKLATSSSQVDSLLACNWSFQTTSLSNATESRSAISSSATVWYDTMCSGLVVSISEISGKINTTATLQERKIGCNTNAEFRSANFYDLQSKAFLIGTVLIDNSIIATEVVLKFDSTNHYELINFSLSEQETPSVICRTLIQNDFNSISASMSPDEINEILNCQWKTTRISESTNTPFSWVDHECNKISIVAGKNKSFIQRKTSGCGSFGAH